MMTLTGSKTTITREALLFKSSLRQCSNNAISMTPSRLATPMRVANSRIDSGVYPRRRSPEIVGIRGSSQPAT